MQVRTSQGLCATRSCQALTDIAYSYSPFNLTHSHCYDITNRTITATGNLVIELHIVLLIFMSGFQNGQPDYITAAYLLSQNIIRFPLFLFLICIVPSLSTHT